MSNLDIPESWAISDLEVLTSANGLLADGDWVETKDQNPKGEIRLVQLADVGDGNFRDRSSRFMSLDAAERLKCTFLVPNDVLVARMPDPLGRACIFPGDEKRCVTVVDVCIVRLDGKILDPKCYMHFINSPQIRGLIGSMASGTTRQRITKAKLSKISLPLPPYGEQNRIVTKIESIQSKINLIESYSKRAELLLEKYREALLQKAFRGELVPQDPNDEPASKLLERIRVEQAPQYDCKKKKRDEQPPFKPDEIPFEIPKNWEWVRFGEVVEMMRGRFSIRPRNDPTCFGGKYPFVQIGSLDSFGSVVNEASQSLNEKGYKASKLFPKGTIMIAIVGGTIGNLGVLGQEMCFPDSIIGIIPSKFYNQEFILNFLRYKQKDIRQSSYQLAGQPNIKLPTLENLLIPLPPLKEQEKIVEMLDRQRDLTSQIKPSSILEICQKISEATLKKAFQGRLVNQIENEGTGHAILKKIVQFSKSENEITETKTAKSTRFKGKSR